MAEANPDEELHDLEQLVDRIDAAARDADPVSLGGILDFVGGRSFGPLLLLAGLITVMPLIGDIPGVPITMGLLVILIALQLLFRRDDHLWLPDWMLRRSVSRDRLCKALDWMRRPAAFIDKFIRPRLTVFVSGPATIVIAVLCILIAAATPVMEVVPFSANLAGAALIAFGLALIARDGLLSLIAFIFTAGTIGILIYNLVSG